MAGGLDTYGMAEYKMSQAVSQAEVERVAQLGVKFVVNTEVGLRSEPPAWAGDQDATDEIVRSAKDTSAIQTVSISDLEEWHDAIFLAVGLGQTRKLNIPGEELDGVLDALAFIERVKTREWKSVPLGRAVAVIGAGNTAIDAVTQAKRLGAETVKLVYRKSENEIPAYDYEYELAKQDGVEFVWKAAPIGILESEDGGTVAGLRCEKTDGSMQLFDISCDTVIKATGQAKMHSFFTDVCKVETDESGRVIVNELMQTSNPKIFAGGDCVNGGGEAVEAAQMGKLAAQGIHQALAGQVVEFAGANPAGVERAKGNTH